MNRLLSKLTIAAAFAAFDSFAIWPFGGMRSTSEPFVFAEDGQAKAVIVAKTEGHAEGYRYAANELADYLGKITGARFAVVDKPISGFATIRVGTDYHAARTDELHIEVRSSNELVITGDDALGTLYGVYDLLETFGCRFYCHDFEKVPATNVLELAAGYVKTDAPFMVHRQNWSGPLLDRSDAGFVFMMKHRQTTLSETERWAKFAPRRSLGLAQTLCTHYIPRNTFLNQKKCPETYHPEWYALRKDGSRCQSGLCVSNNEMFHELCVEIEKDIVENKATEISISIDDGCEICHCPDCEKITLSDSTRSDGCQNIVLLNRVARHFADKYPSVRFNMLIYGPVSPADTERFRLEPNAGFAFALLWRNHCRPCYTSDRVGRSITDWTRFSNLGFENWDYGCNFFTAIMPFPNYDVFGANFRWYKEQGITGIGSQTQITTNGDMAELNHYVFDKLCWNPDADDKAITEEFLNDVYGAAAPQIAEYMHVVLHARDRWRWFWGGCYLGATEAFLTDDDCLRIYRIQEAMDSLSRRMPMPRKIHVQRARIPMLYVCGVRYDDLAVVAEKARQKLVPREKIAETCDRIFNDMSNRLPLYDNVGERESFAASLAHMRNVQHDPYKSRTDMSIRFAPSQMTGGERKSIQKTDDGTSFMRLDTVLKPEEGTMSLFMDPDKAECGVTLGDRSGDWYVFSTVRTATTADWEPASAFFGIYLNHKYIYGEGKCQNAADEAADMLISGEKGKNDWRLYCLGKYRLGSESRVWVMPSGCNRQEYVDVREFVFIAPEMLDNEKDVKCYVPAGRISCSGKGKIERDKYDSYLYWHVEGAETTNTVLTCKITKDTMQEAYVLVRMRLGATIPMDRTAGRISLVNKDGDVIASVDVEGSPFDDGWQMLSLGRHQLEPDMKIEIAAGRTNPVRFLDVRNVNFINPDLIEGKSADK